MTVAELLDLTGKIIQDWPCTCPEAYLTSACFAEDCPTHTLGLALVTTLMEAMGDEAKIAVNIALTVDLNAKCRHCQRPMAAHCAGCGSCWPDAACGLDCDVNAPHPSWTEPEL